MEKENDKFDPKKYDASKYDAELKELEVQAARLSILEKEANLQDVKERLAEREMQRENKRQRSYINGQTLKQNNNVDRARQKVCTHRKGGKDIQSYVNGKGNDQYFAIVQHMFCNGDIWVTCQRCHATWMPPARSTFTDAKGEFDQKGYDAAQKEYETVLEWPTDNSPSGSYVFKFSDNGEYYRELTKNSNLR